MKSAIKRFADIFFDPFYGQYSKALESEIVGSCKTLLDVGCGATSPIGLFSKRLERCVGVDSHAPSVASSQKAGIHHEYHVMDVMGIGKQFPKKSFDAVLLSDVIEHLDRDSALRLIAMAEGVARKKVIIFTPNGFLPQPAADNNPHQAHVSGWDTEEMQGLGYEVTGINGWKPLRGTFAKIAWHPAAFWGKVSLLTQPLVLRHPRHAFHLFCVKNLSLSPPDQDRGVL